MSKVMPFEETLNPTLLFHFREKRRKKAPDEPGQTSQGGNLFTWLEEEALCYTISDRFRTELQST
jgi:hypothetical protein